MSALGQSYYRNNRKEKEEVIKPLNIDIYIAFTLLLLQPRAGDMKSVSNR